MTKIENLEQLNNFKSELNELMRKISDYEAALQNTNDNEDILSKYASDIEDCVYWVDANNEIDWLDDGISFDKGDIHPYCNYPSREYAEQSQKIKDFNDKLLAFKWCYDRDYTPDWKDSDESKYYVYYDVSYKEYDYDWIHSKDTNNIYFSSEEIAQKCCDWLNSISE